MSLLVRSRVKAVVIESINRHGLWHDDTLVEDSVGVGYLAGQLTDAVIVEMEIISKERKEGGGVGA